MMSILMFIFSVVILFYALLLAWTKDIKLIRRSYAVKMKNEKAYAVQFAKILAFTSTILCVRGNCDYPEDQAMLDFPIMADYCLLYVKDKRIFAAHGNRAIPNLASGDIFLHGHTHVPTLDSSKDYIELNPGSVSEPRRGSAHSHLLLDDEGFTWKDLDGNIFHKLGVI